jgi:hypothetical protein
MTIKLVNFASFRGLVDRKCIFAWDDINGSLPGGPKFGIQRVPEIIQSVMPQIPNLGPRPTFWASNSDIASRKNTFPHRSIRQVGYGFCDNSELAR